MSKGDFPKSLANNQGRGYSRRWRLGEVREWQRNHWKIEETGQEEFLALLYLP
jgi:hypothetical protein